LITVKAGVDLSHHDFQSSFVNRLLWSKFAYLMQLFEIK